MKFLIIVILMLLIVAYKNKEGLNNYIDPIDPARYAIYQQMLTRDTSANVESDLAYFNNTSNLLYGFQRMPTL